MAQIFVSHSAKNARGKDFLNQAFATTKVEAKYEEIEEITTGKRTTAQITQDVQFSNAIFVLLSQHVEQTRHTRDWVVSESATGRNRDVWVLESVEDMPKLSVVIPRVRHYVLFDYTNPYLVYLRQIIASYDDSHFLPVAVAGAGLGGGISESVPGALIGSGVAWFLAYTAAQKARPTGLEILCPKCRSAYNIHLLGAQVMRCPVCNERLGFAQAQGVGAGQT